uniref:Uncharacterized protein n=1 Tax=Tanacetum cinerariifolium TaxID=118510 RepID=A0A6L2JB72_TANCI|nr:hypothetical protein [Tanacetum cinerariifolium]
MQEDSKVQEVVEVVNAAKLITEVVTAATTQVIPAAEPVVAAISTPISAAKPKGLRAILAAPTVSTRKRKGVVIRDHEEELHDDTPTETQFAKDKGKDVQPKDAPAKGIQYIRRYHGYKKKPQSESQACKNMIDYIKNTKGFKMAFFKGKTYDQIRPIFQARFDANMRFLLKSKEEMEKEEEEIIKSINETPSQKAAKRRRLRKQAKEAEDLKKQLEVVADEDDDVFVEATPIGTKSLLAQVGDLSSHSTKYSSPALTQKVFPNMRREGKGFPGVDKPLFEGMIVAQQADEGAAKVNGDDVPAAGVADESAASVVVNDVPAAVDEPSIPSPTPPTQPPLPSQDLPSTSHAHPTLTPSLSAQPLSTQSQPQSSQNAEILMDLLHTLLETWRGIIAYMDADVNVTLQDVADIAKEVSIDAEIKESADDDEVEPFDLQKVVEVVTTAKLMTEVVTTASATIIAADTTITVAAPTLTIAPSAVRRKKGLVIIDPKETATPSTIIYTEPKSKDKGKGIMVHEPKPLKKKTQIEQDKAYARELV